MTKNGSPAVDCPRWVSPCGRMELRCGRWQDVLSDITECDAVITDPPYSERTHDGQRTGSSIRTPTIDYDCMTETLAEEMAHFCIDLSPFWVIVWSDHAAQLWHENALRHVGFYTFAPLPWVKHPAPPRLSGDGPACASEWLTIARTRRRLTGRTGSRPGWYLVKGRVSCKPKAGIAGVKDLDGVRSLIRHYSLQNDLLVDPHAGTGTTLLAAAIVGRRCIGAEMDPKTYDLAVKRLSKGYTPRLQLPNKPKPKQRDLWNSTAK